MLKPIEKRFQVSSFLVLYLITSVQIGVGVLGFQPILLDAGNDGWLAILLAGLMVHIVIWMLYKLLKNGKGDLIDVHKQAYGKWLGHFFSIVVMFYFIFTAITVLRSYIEVIQVWVFPSLPTWSLVLVFIMLTYYVVMGGFRTVAGISFFSMVLPAYLLLTFLFPIKFAKWENLAPLFTLDILPLFSASMNMTLSYMGFSTLLIFYPFIEKGEKSQKWAHIGTLLTTFVYVFIEVISTIYYSQDLLKEVTWPTLGLWKIVELPFVERFEYIGISSWLIVILPNITLLIWAASRIGKRVFGFQQKYVLVITLLLIFIGCWYFETREEVDQLNTFVSNFGRYYNYIYIPILLIIHTIMIKVRKGK